MLPRQPKQPNPQILRLIEALRAEAKKLREENTHPYYAALMEKSADTILRLYSNVK